jgi:hypothetical protein
MIDSLPSEGMFGVIRGMHYGVCGYYAGYRFKVAANFCYRLFGCLDSAFSGFGMAMMALDSSISMVNITLQEDSFPALSAKN